MARSSIAEQLDRVEGKPVKCALKGTKETFVRGGQLFEQARNHCGYSQEQAADYMGVSPGLLSRQIDNTDNQHLSFQRICEMPAVFRRELVRALMNDLRDEGAPVRRREVWEFEDERRVG